MQAVAAPDTSAMTAPAAPDASMTLEELAAAQKAFDERHFTGADTPDAKRRHICFHVGILAGKLSRVEESADHGPLTDEARSLIAAEAIPDLLVYAAQLAALSGVRLDDAYRDRLAGLRDKARRPAPPPPPAAPLRQQEALRRSI